MTFTFNSLSRDHIGTGFVAEFRVEVTPCFQLPLSGSRDHPDRGAATLPYPDLSTPSLGITHVRAHALPQEDTFQLPLSGSPEYSGADVSYTATSFQLPLSGSR